MHRALPLSAGLPDQGVVGPAPRGQWRLWRVVLSMLFFPLLYTGLVSFRCRPGCGARWGLGPDLLQLCPSGNLHCHRSQDGGIHAGEGENCRRQYPQGESHQRP